MKIDRDGSLMRLLLNVVLPATVLVAALGCQPYELAGVVVAARGEPGGVRVVKQDDERLNSPGLAETTVILTLDPDSLRPIRLGSVTTDEQGRFRMPVDETGAGFLEYDLGVYARKKGFAPTWQQLPLPARGRRLVVLMQPGVDRELIAPDPIRETIEMLPPSDRAGLEGLRR